MAEKKRGAGNPLKIICIIGLILALFISWGLVFFGFIWGRNIPGKGKSPEYTFAEELREYDLLNAPKRALEGDSGEEIERRLAQLQKQARRAEEQLSVLKRRRALALADRRYIPAYAKAAGEAAETYAYSAPIAAAAAEAVIMGSGPLSGEALSLLKTYAQGISQYRLDSLELGLHILAGNLESPAKAAAIPDLVNLLSSNLLDLPNLSDLPEQGLIDLRTDEFLLLAYREEIPGASLKMNALLNNAAPETIRTEMIRMGAEFFYDRLNPLRAAGLFSKLPDERDIARAADALALAGEVPGARNIWLALSSETGDPVPARIRSRSLYNLAASSADTREETAWLEKLFSMRTESQRPQREQAPDSTEAFSVIRYTRFLDSARSIAILDNYKQNPLFDLELLRRRLETLPPTRAAAEVWLLLGRHPEEEALFEWAAWYFDHQKLFDETARLVKDAARKGMAGSWTDLHRSFALLREGKIFEGEKLLRDVYARETSFQGAGNRNADWRIPANLGRIQESRRAIPAALELYEAAAALIAGQRPAENAATALVQTRLSRCLEALGRTRESRRALEYAVELDPDNLNIRRELRRFDAR